MKKLSIFVDESGDFGEFNKVTEFYIVSFVFHDKLVHNLEKVVGAK